MVSLSANNIFFDRIRAKLIYMELNYEQYRKYNKYNQC